MNRFANACLLSALFGVACAAAASPTIELKDGSRIEGEIQGLANGVYTVVSPSLGTVHVAQSNIVRIVYGGAGANAAAPASAAPAPATAAPARNDALSRNVQDVQARLAQDPSAMQSIMGLQNDPQIQAILNDPAIMKAIQDGDFMSLLGNEKIQALEGNEHLMQLIQQQAH